jgi:hypothetical protein
MSFLLESKKTLSTLATEQFSVFDQNKRKLTENGKITRATKSLEMMI